jgi:small ligand-binding sensory domain FIST
MRVPEMSARSFCTTLPGNTSREGTLPGNASRSGSLAAPDGLGRALAAVRAEVASPSGGLVFVSGAMTQEIDRVAEQVRAAWRGVPTCIVPGAGVLTERGEIEAASAASGVLWSGGRAAPFSVGDADAMRDLGPVLASARSESTGGNPTSAHPSVMPPSSGRRATALVFARSDVAGDALEGIGAGPDVTIFGAGTVGSAAVALSAEGDVLRGRAVGLLLQGLAAPLIDASPACRLLTGFQTVEEVAGNMVLRVGGSAALDLLSSSMADDRSAASAAQGAASPPPAPQGVVFVALADPSSEGESDERYVVRPVRGIDPGRRGVVVGHDVVPGTRLAFAVRDAAAARAGLEATARALSQQALGSAPRFALFLSCAGRGQGLYGAPDVEARILRQRFGDLPIAGMHSAFEIMPWRPGEARLALYTGVLALFRSPS